MAKARKKKKARKAASKRRPAKTAKRKVKTKARKAPRKTKRRAKPKQDGVIDTVVGTVEEAAALRRRLVGPESFED